MSKLFRDLMSLEHIKKFWPSTTQVCLPKSKLYHYTSSIAFNSIIQNQSLWMTKSNFMNDMSEIIYAKEIFISRLNKSNIQGHDKEKIISSMEKNIEQGLFDNIFILCFSTNQDSLPLWSYYGKNEGYNIGIDESFVSDLSECKFIERKTLRNGQYETEKVKKCVDIDQKDRTSFGYKIIANYVLYSEEEQIRIIDSFIEAVQLLIESDEQDKYLQINLCLSQLVEFIPFMKHKSYVNEDEYRILIQFDSRDTKLELDKIQNYRVFNGALIPYIIIKLNKKDYFKSIGLSPFNKSELSINGIKELCKAYPYHLDIMISEIPSRF